MKINKIILGLFAVSMLLIGCSDFDELNTNPDTPTEATPALLATRIIWNMAGPDDGKTFGYDYQRGKYIGWAEGASDEQYNYFGRGSFGGYTILTTAKKMVEQAEDSPQYDSYAGLEKFLKAYKLYNLTIRMGDIPYSDALDGEEGETKPVYDTQKDVFLQILDDLDDAYQLFGNATQNFEGDIIYDGNNEQWQKMVSGFKLKVLMTLSNKEDDSDLNIIERFKSTLANQKIFESNSDNFQLEFANQSGMVYPWHKTESKHTDYILMSSFFMDMMKETKDYRMFYYAAPAEKFISDGTPADSWDAYAGVDVTLPFNEMGAIASKGESSKVSRRYKEEEVGEPFAKLRYSDINFLLAEAALRGWIDGDANAYYLEGIKADLKFEETYMVDNEAYHHGRIINDSYINQFISKPEIQLTGSFENKLKQIMTQKYISNFFQIYELDAYMEYRRTGYPEFPINPNTNQNEKTDRIPVRFMYPSDESSYNTENLQEAIDRQFNGNDNVNEKIWILK